MKNKKPKEVKWDDFEKAFKASAKSCLECLRTPTPSGNSARSGRDAFHQASMNMFIKAIGYVGQNPDNSEERYKELKNYFQNQIDSTKAHLPSSFDSSWDQLIQTQDIDAELRFELKTENLENAAKFMVASASLHALSSPKVALSREFSPQKSQAFYSDTQENQKRKAWPAAGDIANFIALMSRQMDVSPSIETSIVDTIDQKPVGTTPIDGKKRDNNQRSHQD